MIQFWMQPAETSTRNLPDASMTVIDELRAGIRCGSLSGVRWRFDRARSRRCVCHANSSQTLSMCVPGRSEAGYDLLCEYDCTTRHLLPRQSGCAGPVPERTEELRPVRETSCPDCEHLRLGPTRRLKFAPTTPWAKPPLAPKRPITRLLQNCPPGRLPPHRD